MRPARRAGALALGLSLALTACGGGGGTAGGTSATRATSVATPTVPTATATVPATTPTATVPATTSTALKAPTTTVVAPTPPEAKPGGAGDEQGTRVPAVFTVRGAKLIPPSIAIPAFLRIALTVRNADPGAHTVGFHGHTLKVGPQGTSSVFVAGLRKGRYPVTVDGRAAGAIVTGAKPGP